MTLARIPSCRAKAACMASGSYSQSLEEPSMSVNRKVRVPVGGLATTLKSSLLPLIGHYSSVGFLGSCVRPTSTSSSWRTSAESRTSQVRAQIRCIWILRDEAQAAEAAAWPSCKPLRIAYQGHEDRP